MNVARPVPRDSQIVEIRRISSRPTPTVVGVLAPELPRVPRRQDPTVALLLVSGVVFLVVGVATMSIIAWLAGVVSFVTAFTVDTRHERELRDVRRSHALDDLRRSHRNPSRVRRRTAARHRVRVNRGSRSASSAATYDAVRRWPARTPVSGARRADARRPPSSVDSGNSAETASPRSVPGGARLTG